MSNRAKKKGTGFEREVMEALEGVGFKPYRTSPGSPWDIVVPGQEPFEVLATRPDRGEALVTLPLKDFIELLREYNRHGDDYGARIECKRFARFAHHTIYTD